ncbi:MAG: hypothetical protein JNL87_12330 [Burkholderiaceae bacterium]|nr:hypothetical protein [Burkholderiaceae bacterium]
MSLFSRLRFVILLSGFSLAALAPAHADFELRSPDGKRILLKDDGTWRYLDAEAAQAGAPAASAPAGPKPMADLHMLRRVEIPGGCGFVLALINNLPYEVRSLVPEFTVQRSSGVVYSSQVLGFGPVKPGDIFQRDLRVLGIGCQDIARLQVGGGDRCDMGELNKFSDAKGECLARVRVVPNEVLTFDK